MSFLGLSVQELSALSARDWSLAGLVSLAVLLIFSGLLVPYRLVRRSDYETAMQLLKRAQDTNETNAKSLETMANSKDLATTMVEAIRAELSPQRGAVQEERT